MTDQVTRTDVIVLGMGVGGESVAGQLADAGLDVVGVEAELVGGECPYWACIPTKMMLRAAELLAEGRRIPGMAGASTVDPDWAPVAKRIREEATDDWDDTVAAKRFEDKGGRLLRGRGRILGPDRVEIEGAGVVEATRGLVVASGTTASVPPIDGLDATPYWTNREAVATETVPGSLIVIGAGAVGCELGQVFARFGSTVTMIESADQPLPAEEPESGRVLSEALHEDGVDLRLGDSASRVDHDDSAFTVHLKNGDPVTAERLLVATGRSPRMAQDDWDALGLAGDAGLLPVDNRLRVADGVWAVGDITGEGAFTHVATYQADIVAGEILGHDVPVADYRALPRVTFTDPEIGGVGLTESQARAKGIDVAIGTADVAKSARGWLHKAGSRGIIKIVVDTASDTIVGATSAGPMGGEVLGALTVAVRARVPVSELEWMIYAYPTFHRGIQDAIRDLRAHS